MSAGAVRSRDDQTAGAREGAIPIEHGFLRKGGFKALQSGGRPDADQIIEIERIQQCNLKSATKP
jgi:hypothetical protein